MKKYGDEKRIHNEFAISDMVLVKLQPYRQHIVALRKKLEAQFTLLWSFSCRRENWCNCLQVTLAQFHQYSPSVSCLTA